MLKITAPRVNDKREGQKFTSALLPPYMRRTPRLEEAIPVLYLRGLSTGDFKEALATLLGEEVVTGFSPTTITRLLSVWQEERRTWQKRSLAHKQYVYIWADGVHFNVRLEDGRLACLVIIGVRPDGVKEVIALDDGYRESTESWLTLLRDLKARGMKAPKLAMADGALGFWAALRQVFPETEEQRCWVHKIANVLDKLPQRLQSKAKEQLHEIMRAPDRQSAQEEMERFTRTFADKYPKAVATLTKLVFSLIPTEYAELGWMGWIIQIAPPAEPDHNYTSIVTPPFRGVNALQIIGWHFRNSDNTGANDGSVNAPQEERNFLFVTNEEDYQTAFAAVDCVLHPSQCEDMDDQEAFAIHESVPKSEGTLLITELELGNLVPEQQAWIEHMAFEVEIRWSAEEIK